MKKSEITKICYLSIQTWSKPTEVYSHTSTPLLDKAAGQLKMSQSHSSTKLPPISLRNCNTLPPRHPEEGETEFASPNIFLIKSLLLDLGSRKCLNDHFFILRKATLLHIPITHASHFLRQPKKSRLRPVSLKTQTVC